MSPEEQARADIDRLLTAAGWTVVGVHDADLRASRGVAIREFALDRGYGFADYLPYVDGKAAGVIEAKKRGATLTGVEIQSARYAQGLPASLPAWRRPLPFVYESTGAETHFTNALDPEPRARNVYAFHRPETPAEWIRGLPQAVELSTGASPLSDHQATLAPATFLTGMRDMPPRAQVGSAQRLSRRTHPNLDPRTDGQRVLLDRVEGRSRDAAALQARHRALGRPHALGDFALRHAHGGPGGDQVGHQRLERAVVAQGACVAAAPTRMCDRGEGMRQGNRGHGHRGLARRTVHMDANVPVGCVHRPCGRVRNRRAVPAAASARLPTRRCGSRESLVRGPAFRGARLNGRKSSVEPLPTRAWEAKNGPVARASAEEVTGGAG